MRHAVIRLCHSKAQCEITNLNHVDVIFIGKHLNCLKKHNNQKIQFFHNFYRKHCMYFYIYTQRKRFQ